MVDVIETTELAGARRRMDKVTSAAVVVTVDAVLFLAIAVVGVPFLMFVFADETGTWARLWPYVGSWVLAGVGGAACAAATYGLTRSGAQLARHGGAAAAVGAAVVAVLISALLWRSLMLGPVTAVFVIANLIAAFVLFSAKEPSFARFQPATLTPEPSPLPEMPGFAPTEDTTPEAHDLYRRPGRGTESETKSTIDLQVRPRPGSGRRRPRTQPALRTHAGIQLPPRARRTRP
ncbi:hypothetical protein [Paractinoplanes atraurantiacus]|uniref:Uncharacterized protein n=1 Tax=Paractinoplanes atraurantiacus TaxID=1036182 RepID=A0A285K9K3_9ACTN|nr:hypothetical protein [Actinoplanes atraurantiacus]SNY68903.1 hypothetical protein SAMN05421748_13457 [Actinoplanes atraurantiacus]